jgi:hypothetical protein
MTLFFVFVELIEFFVLVELLSAISLKLPSNPVFAYTLYLDLTLHPFNPQTLQVHTYPPQFFWQRQVWLVS